MKLCPVCQTRYDEEILRFCIKDGTPLVDENPSFKEMPSESGAEDIGEETVIRRNPPQEVPPAQPGSEQQHSGTAQRIVIPMKEADDDFSEAEFIAKEPVRAKIQPEHRPEPKSNTALVVLVTVLGTIVVFGGLGAVVYLLNNRDTANSNDNTNRNITVNTNTNETNVNANEFLINANLNNVNFDINANANVNINANVNANLKTPTPTRTPTPKPTATPEESGENANSNSNANTGNINAAPRPSISPTVTPVSSPSPSAPPQNVNVGVMNSRAVSLTKPAYPQAARQMNASGEVRVQVSVDDSGNVTSVRAISGHPLLRSAAENAARQSRFNPIKVGDRNVSATGVVVYNFINQ